MLTPAIEPFWSWKRFWKEKLVTCGFSFYITSSLQLENAVAFHQAHDDGRGVDTL